MTHKAATVGRGTNAKYTAWYNDHTMTLHDLENAIAGLPPDELNKFRAWFVDFDADAWDRQIEQDVIAGRLDELASEALEVLRSGQQTNS